MGLSTATLDLSSVTSKLTAYLTAQITSSTLWGANPSPITSVSGLMPERSRGDEASINFYLFHVSPAPFVRNTPASQIPKNSAKELGLTLYYLLTAHSKSSSDVEQQLMGLAIKALYERPTFIEDGGTPQFNFTVNMEVETPDEANRRWQSYSAPFRLSTVYRVSVVFLLAREDPPDRPGTVQKIGLALSANKKSLLDHGSLAATASTIKTHPDAPKEGDDITYDYSPAIASAGDTFVVLGNNLKPDACKRLYLLDADGKDLGEVNWNRSLCQPVGVDSFSRFDVTLPGVPACPKPGIYQILFGASAASGDTLDYKTNSIPLLIGPVIDAPPSTWVKVNGFYELNGAAFVNPIQLRVGSVNLTRAAGATPSAGEFVVSASGDKITFLVPASFALGLYQVAVRTGGVERFVPRELTV